jgi:hypothetical protein
MKGNVRRLFILEIFRKPLEELSGSQSLLIILEKAGAYSWIRLAITLGSARHL